MKNAISIILILSVLFSFISCAGSSSDAPVPDDTTLAEDTQDTSSETQNEDTTIYYEPDLLPEKLDFGGRTITFLTDGTPETSEISIAEITNEPVNDSLFYRERYVEEKLNVEIVDIPQGDFISQLRKVHTADEDAYQVADHNTFEFSTFVFEHYFMDLSEFEYLHLDSPWWSQKFNEKARIDEKSYIVTGPITLSLNRNIYAMFYNKKLAEDYSGRIPELSDLYGLVDSGLWTYDKLVELCGDVYEDINGNQERDGEDVYGLGIVGSVELDPIWSCFDINILSRTDDGWFELDVNTDKMYNAFDMMSRLFFDINGVFCPGYEEDLLKDLAVKFAGDTLLFHLNELEYTEKPVFRNMQSDYGVLPFPKYDESQKEYYSYAHDSYVSFAILVTDPQPEQTAAVLEALASYAYRETEPTYLNIALKGKYMSDPQSRKMIDILVDNVKLDTAWIYLKSLANSYPSNFRKVVYQKTGSYASAHESMKQGVTRSIKTYKLSYESKLK